MDYDLYGVEALAECISTFRRISKDREHHISMVEDDELSVIDFDMVKDRYVKSHTFLNDGDIPQSVDGLYRLSEDRYAFIEFKNGNLGHSGEKFALREKVYHSIMLLIHIAGVSLDWIREHCIYVLVYNAESNKKELARNPRNNNDISESIDF